MLRKLHLAGAAYFYRARTLSLALGLAPSVLWLAVFYFGSLLALIATALWRCQGPVVIKTISLTNFERLVTQPLWRLVFGRTLLYAVLVGLTDALLALPLACFLVFVCAPRLRGVLLAFTIAPLWANYLLRAYSWKMVLGTSGVLNTFLMSVGVIGHPLSSLVYSPLSVYIALVHVWLPFAVLPMVAVLERIPPPLLEASEDLGARPWQQLRRVILPLAAPGITAGFFYSFSLTMGDFVTPNLLGSGSQFMGNVIANQFGVNYCPPMGAALAAPLLLTLVVLIGVVARRGIFEAL